MKRKILVSSLVVLTLTSPVISTTYAEQKEKSTIKILEKQKEVKSLDELYKKAKLNKHDIDIKENVKTERFATTQILETREEQNKIVQDIAVTTFEDVTVLDSVIQTRATGQQSDNATDNSISYRAYSTVYYTTGTVGGMDAKKVTRVTGGWTKLDSTVFIQSRLVRVGSTNYQKTQTIEYAPTSDSFDYTTPASWQLLPVEIGLIAGCVMDTTYKRNSSTWRQVFENHL